MRDISQYGLSVTVRIILAPGLIYHQASVSSRSCCFDYRQFATHVRADGPSHQLKQYPHVVKQGRLIGANSRTDLLLHRDFPPSFFPPMR